jgi:hypothetical protein
MLLSNSYHRYTLGVINLVSSFIIKSSHTINSINSFISLGGEEISVFQKEWKYYKNIAGKHYSGSTGFFDNSILTVYSLDTKEVIELNEQTAKLHLNTITNLQSKGLVYKQLIEKYPDDTLLINGILFPIDIDLAIAANDYEIIHYDKTLVGKTEYNLIPEVQKWINNYVSRWDVTAFSVTDKLYPSAHFGILILNLVPAIINIRLNNCKTPFVHEFHIWNYLSSYFKLDRYKDKISHEQSMFLYRNIDCSISNAGYQNTL